MKNQKGVTLTILIATVVVMAIITGSISLYYLQNKELPILEAESKKTDEIIENYSQDNVNYNPNNSNTLYKIDLKKLGNLSLKNTEYYIDSTSHTIYSLRGVKIEGKTYHTIPLSYEKVDLLSYQ